jgi:sulfite exporter TauE/SafE
MFQIAIAAFTMGIIGSFHCVGMCGPLALALPLSNNSLLAKLTGALLYNSGRIVTYSLFGLLSGLLGKSFTMLGFQQWLSMVLGAIIILLVIVPKLFPGSFKQVNFATHFFQQLRHTFGQLFFRKNQSTLFAIGFLNGLLPCGLVYLAIAAATAAGDISSSMVFMAAFGLGTLPVMWSIAFWGNFIGISIRQKIRAAYPFMMLLMACLLIIRGMGLGIPYLSPETDMGKKIISCCSKP